MTDTRIADLLASRAAAKAEEDKAVAARRAIDAEIVKLFTPPAGDEGSVSTTVGDAKVAVTFKLDRKVDDEAVKRDWENLLPAVQMAFRFKADVALKNLKALDGDNLRQALKYVTTKPATPSLSIETVKAD